MHIDELKYWVAFKRVPTIGRARFQTLLSRFGSMREAWHASSDALSKAGLESKSVRAISAMRSRVDPDAEIGRLQDSGIAAFTWEDEEYPSLLKEIYDLPPVLFVKGKLLAEDQRGVAVVGTRRATAYGREAAGRLTSDLATSGVTVVSGLARGIDAIAHKTALDAGGRTIAVLANGLDSIYPPEHKALASQIVENGALVSEHSLGRARSPATSPGETG